MSDSQLFNTDTYRPPRPPAPDLDIAVGRILDVHDRASDQQVDEGMEWYDEAHKLATDMHSAYPRRVQTIAHAAGLIAALSPNESWDNNVANAWMFLKFDTSRSLPRSIADARLICHGFDPEIVLFRNGVNYKVQSFYQNIVDPLDENPVTIDRHAKGIIYDDPLIVKLKPHANRADYEAYSVAYREAARQKRILPSQMQAITWLAWRNLPHKHSSRTGIQLSIVV